ncbi:MAG: hypothetical protein Edafosvirus17_14 [Edafosvirus sp.]|uniref:Uncharacterized protein n=1 Tax=Edafosvirus sp. TaxID=2487765 RepID=A0A3G4ZUG7_9VIRU|nr:MAG: hypothetical protein Edafosvirus17_14 [Edafosvirus sp.]
MKIVLLALCIQLVFAKELADSVKSVAGTIASPEVKASIEVLEALRTTSSTKISDRYEPAGFTYFVNTMDYSRGAIHADNLDKQIKFWLSDKIFNGIPQVYHNILPQAIEEYSLQVMDEEYHKQKYELSFNNGAGTLFMLQLMVTPHPTKANVMRWEKYLLMSSFKPSAPYVIVTKSKCNILKCSADDKIVYMPVSMTDSHIRTVIDLNLQILSQFNKKSQLAIGS